MEGVTQEQRALVVELAGQGYPTNTIAARAGLQAYVVRAIKKEISNVSSTTNELSDEDLGIGEEGGLPPLQAKPASAQPQPAPSVTVEDLDAPAPSVDGQAAAIQALLASPAMQAAIDQMVAARVASAQPISGDLLAGFTSTIKHLIDTNAQQQPGFVKPLPAEVVAERAAGEVEMRALLAEYEEADTPPLYIVGEGGFFECTNAIEKNEGDKIYTYLPPPEGFIPRNAEARKVYAAMLQWIGGPSPDIGERVKQAHLDAKAPQVIGSSPMSPIQAKKPLIVDAPLDADEKVERAAVKRRGMGTIVPDPIDLAAGKTGVGGLPSGPF